MDRVVVKACDIMMAREWLTSKPGTVCIPLVWGDLPWDEGVPQVTMPRFSRADECTIHRVLYAMLQQAASGDDGVCRYLAHHMRYQAVWYPDGVDAMGWVQRAIEQFQSDAEIQAIQATMRCRVNQLAQDLNETYDRVVFLGWHDTDWPLVQRLYSQLRGSIGWLIPSTTSETVTIEGADSLIGGPASVLLDALAAQGAPYVSPFDGQRFDTVDQEIESVLTQLNDMTGPRVLVVPNDTLRDRVQAAAIRMGVPVIPDAVSSFSMTVLGQWVYHAIDYIRQPTFEGLRRLMDMMDWPDGDAVMRQVQDIHARIGFFFSESQAMSAVLAAWGADHWVHGVASMRGVLDIHAQVTAHGEMWGMDASYEGIREILTRAADSPTPFDDVVVMLDHGTVCPPVVDSTSIGCIRPEWIGAYLDHTVWVMGMGHMTWANTEGDELAALDGALPRGVTATLRVGYGAWGLTHPRLAGVSMSEYVDHDRQYGVPGLDVTWVPQAREANGAGSIQRVAPSSYVGWTGTVLTPSMAQHYQRCPYAFYLKAVMMVDPPRHPLTDRQVIGTVMHDVIEHMVVNPAYEASDARAWIDRHVPGLLGHIVRATVDRAWPLADLVQFCQSDRCQTEVSLSREWHGVRIEGRCDILIQHEHEWHVIDIKSGTPPTKAMVRQYDDIQLGLYVWMLMGDKAWSPSIPIYAHYYTKNNRLTTVMATNEASFESMYDGFMARMGAILGGMRTRAFSPTDALVGASSRQTACRYCAYYGVCHHGDRHYR